MMQLTYEEKFLTAAALRIVLEDREILSIPPRQVTVLRKAMKKMIDEMRNEAVEFTDATEQASEEIIQEAYEHGRA